MTDLVLGDAARMGYNAISVTFTFGSVQPNGEFAPLDDDVPVAISTDATAPPFRGQVRGVNVHPNLDPDFLDIIKAISVLYAHLSDRSTTSQVEEALRDSVSQRMEAAALRHVARALRHTSTDTDP